MSEEWRHAYRKISPHASLYRHFAATPALLSFRWCDLSPVARPSGSFRRAARLSPCHTTASRWRMEGVYRRGLLHRYLQPPLALLPCFDFSFSISVTASALLSARRSHSNSSRKILPSMIFSSRDGAQRFIIFCPGAIYLARLFGRKRRLFFLLARRDISSG